MGEAAKAKMMNHSLFHLKEKFDLILCLCVCVLN